MKCNGENCEKATDVNVDEELELKSEPENTEDSFAIALYNGLNKKSWIYPKVLCLLTIKEDTEEDDVLAILAASIYWQKAEREKCHEHIIAGLRNNYSNYELYFMRGNYYTLTNPNQAWLSYQNAAFYCSDAEDLQVIKNYQKELELRSEIQVSKVFVVILSYNVLEYTKQCMESIRRNNEKKAMS